MSQALFERWINGDESAFEALYDGYYARIRHFATALIGNPTEGEDLAQETFMRLHRHRSHLQQTGVENGRALLYTIARRLAYQYTAYRRRWENLADLQPLQVIERETPEALLSAAEIGAHIQQAIDSLPEPQREVTLLRHREMLTYDEIAHILNSLVALDNGAVLKPESMKTLWRPTVMNDGSPKNYGLAWTIDTYKGNKVVGLEGGGAAWITNFPDEHLSIAVVCNLNGVRADDIQYGVADFYLK